MNSSSNGTTGVSEATGMSFTLLVITGCLGVIGLGGFLGNSLVVIVIRRLRRYGLRSSAHTFILNLAWSDLLVCCICIPLTIAVNFITLQADSVSSKALCKILRFLQFLAPTISISILTTICIDRFFALVKPLRSSSIVRRPKWMIAFAWLFSCLLFLPSFFLTNVIEMRVGDATYGYCTTIPNNTTFGLAFLLVVAVMSFLLPLALMTAMYASIVRVVWFRHQTLDREDVSCGQEKVFKRSRKKVLKMFIIVIAVFVICWLPFVIYCGFIEMHVATFPNPGDMIRITTYCLGLSNSFWNPFVYFFSIDWLRKACWDVICCREPEDALRIANKTISSPGLSKKFSLCPKESPNVCLTREATGPLLSSTNRAFAGTAVTVTSKENVFDTEALEMLTSV